MEQAYWITRQEFLSTTSWTGCSKCNGPILFDAKGDKVFTPYCPHCGHPMHQKKALYQIVPKGVCPCCGRKKPKEPKEDKWVQLKKNTCPCCGRRLPREEKGNKWVQLSIFDEEKKDEL